MSVAGDIIYDSGHSGSGPESRVIPSCSIEKVFLCTTGAGDSFPNAIQRMQNTAAWLIHILYRFKIVVGCLTRLICTD